jgi:anti-sigma-K factor RskA
MSEGLDRDSLALDHALGLTEGREAERAERLLETDTAFRASVLSLRSRLAELDLTAPEKPVPPNHFEQIERAIHRVVPSPAQQEKRPGWLERLWAKVEIWRPAALVTAFASLLLAVGLWQSLTREAPRPLYVAVLETAEGRPAAVVNILADGTAMLVPLERIGVPQGRILEVWTLQTRERGPVSIGRMDQARTLKLNLRDLQRPDTGHLFEITVEQPGGSPTGRPTGPILMKGLAAQTL